VIGKCSTVKNAEFCVHEWHKRLAHRNLEDIRAMNGKLITIIPCDHSDFCEPCVMGKMSRKSFPKTASKVENSLDCISSKGYRFIDKNLKVHISREVHFVETKEKYEMKQSVSINESHSEVILLNEDEDEFFFLCTRERL
jgi:GAG-pre-integrase domain